jgi:hypothetical protein
MTLVKTPATSISANMMTAAVINARLPMRIPAFCSSTLAPSRLPFLGFDCTTLLFFGKEKEQKKHTLLVLTSKRTQATLTRFCVSLWRFPFS